MGKSGGKWRKMFIFAHDNKNHLKYADEIPWKHRGEDRRKGPRFPACHLPQGAADGRMRHAGNAQGHSREVPSALS